MSDARLETDLKVLEFSYLCSAIPGLILALLPLLRRTIPLAEALGLATDEPLTHQERLSMLFFALTVFFAQMRFRWIGWTAYNMGMQKRMTMEEAQLSHARHCGRVLRF